MIEFSAAPNRRAVAIYLIWFLSWVFVTGAGAFLTPNKDGHGTHRQLGLPPCPSVLVSGRPCPGCGLTTSFTATIHGQMDVAFRAHPFGTLLYVAFTVSALVCLRAYMRTQYVDFNRKGHIALGVFLAIYMGYGIGRFFYPPEGYTKAPFAIAPAPSPKS